MSYNPVEEYELWQEEQEREKDCEALTEEEEEAIRQLEDFIRNLPDEAKVLAVGA